VNALQFVLDMFKNGPHKVTAQVHSDAIAAAIQNVQTDPNDNLPGDLALAQQTGESEGQQYSLVFCDSARGFQDQINDFESTLSGTYELIDIRMPNLSQVMGKDKQVVGADFGGSGDLQTSMRAINADLIDQFSSPVKVQFKVERLTTTPNGKQGERSGWLSVDQVHSF
jgi:hypothetical protein